MLASDTNLVLKLTLTRCRKLSSWTSHLLHPFKQRIARGSPCVSHVTGARRHTESQNPFQNIYSYICRCHFSKELDGQCLSNCFEKNARFFFFTLTKRGIYLVCARLRVFAPDCAFLRSMLRPAFVNKFWIFQQFGPEFQNQYVSELSLL